MSQNDPNKIMQQYENKSTTFTMFQDTLKTATQSIVNKINSRKIEYYCDKPFDTRKREIVNNLCSSLHEKLGPIIQREIGKILDEKKIQETFKTFDYIIYRNRLFKEIGKEPKQVFDEEEQQLDDLKEYLTEFYNRM